MLTIEEDRISLVGYDASGLEDAHRVIRGVATHGDHDGLRACRGDQRDELLIVVLIKRVERQT